MTLAEYAKLFGSVVPQSWIDTAGQPEDQPHQVGCVRTGRKDGHAIFQGTQLEWRQSFKDRVKWHNLKKKT